MSSIRDYGTRGDASDRDARIRSAIENTTLSDASIANYFNVPEANVSGMRDDRPARIPAHMKEFPQAGIYRGGVTMDDGAKRAAEYGSTQLNRRIWAMYERLAKERDVNHPLVIAVQMGMYA